MVYAAGLPVSKQASAQPRNREPLPSYLSFDLNPPTSGIHTANHTLTPLILGLDQKHRALCLNGTILSLVCWHRFYSHQTLVSSSGSRFDASDNMHQQRSLGPQPLTCQARTSLKIQGVERLGDEEVCWEKNHWTLTEPKGRGLFNYAEPLQDLSVVLLILDQLAYRTRMILWYKPAYNRRKIHVCMQVKKQYRC